jgi:hypothetical protein
LKEPEGEVRERGPATAELLLRRLAVLCLLVGLGVGAGLLPSTTVELGTTPEPAQELSPVWPGHGVQQDLGGLPIPVTRATVWAGAGPTDGRVLVTVALVSGPDSRVLREAILEIPEDSRLLPYSVAFPAYDPPNAETRLQLVVSEQSDNFATFGVTGSGNGYAPPTLNGRELDFQGPLAFRLEGLANGWRAGWMGAGSERGRGVAALALVLLGTAIRVSGDRALRLATAFAGRERDRRPARRDWRRRPWYVGLLTIYPVLSFASSNLATARLVEVLALAGLALLLVTVVALAVLALTRDVDRAAATAAIATVTFFAFGHLSNLLGDRATDGLLLGLLAAGAGGAGVMAFNRPARVRAMATYLNVAALVLVAMPGLTIGYQVARTAFQPAGAVAGSPLTPGPEVTERPDIYYIILDGYPRADSIPDFDNREFVRELEERGFVVPAETQSNYIWTRQSIPSSLNMRYLTGVEGSDDVVTGGGAPGLVRDHRLGRILQAMGYEYLHVASGYALTEASDIADVRVDFSPDGRLTSRGEASASRPVLGEYTRQFLRTTLLRPFLPGYFELPGNEPYPWWHPERTVATFAFLETVASEFTGPKFVLAHLLKPHVPYNLDRLGNMVIHPLEGFGDDHDPAVPSAHVGQILYVNGLLLDTVDAILAGSAQPPIIVIASDHGEGEGAAKLNNMAALYLPGAGGGAVPEDITLVNLFRLVLDRYFGLGLGLLENRAELE